MYYDLELLNKARLPIDHLIQTEIENLSLTHYDKPAPMHPRFNAISLELVKDFRHNAESHIMAILDDYKSDAPMYSYLYYLVDHRYKLYNVVYFEYQNFPLIVERQKVLKEIRKIAKQYAKDQTQLDATCLYLIYFYALLVNRSSNWITMDYLSRGNKYHQHGTRLDRKMETTRKWV